MKPYQPHPNIYQLRIVLRGISPLIWRRLLVRSDTTLAQLHLVLQLLFDWDEHNQPKCEARVPVDHIEAMLAGNPSIYPDTAHSSEETRYLAIGTVDTVRWIFVAFTYRVYGGTRYIRPISARYMHQNEVNRYVEEATNTDE